MWDIIDAVLTINMQYGQAATLCRQLVHAGSMNRATALHALLKLKSNGVGLTHHARDVLSMPDHAQDAELQLLSQQYKGEPPIQQSTIICMTAMKKSHDEAS